MGNLSSIATVTPLQQVCFLQDYAPSLSSALLDRIEQGPTAEGRILPFLELIEQN